MIKIEKEKPAKEELKLFLRHWMSIQRNTEISRHTPQWLCLEILYSRL